MEQPLSERVAELERKVRDLEARLNRMLAVDVGRHWQAPPVANPNALIPQHRGGEVTWKRSRRSV